MSSFTIEEDFVLFTQMLQRGNYLAFSSTFSEEYHSKNRVLIPLADGEITITLYASFLLKNAEKVSDFTDWLHKNIYGSFPH